jgi:hypothetical protein
MLVVLLALAAAPAQAVGATTAIPRLSSAPPAWLSSSAPAPAGLPKTGDDLRREALIAVALLGAGLSLRRRRPTR